MIAERVLRWLAGPTPATPAAVVAADAPPGRVDEETLAARRRAVRELADLPWAGLTPAQRLRFAAWLAWMRWQVEHGEDAVGGGPR